MEETLFNHKLPKKETENPMGELASKIAESEAGVHISIPEKIEQVETAFEAIKYAVSGRNVKVTCELNTPYPSMGAVSVTGRGIRVIDPALFSKVAEMSANFEVYPKTDNTVQMNFTFHNLTRKAGN